MFFTFLIIDDYLHKSKVKHNANSRKFTKHPYLYVPASPPHRINCTRLSWVLQSHLTDTRFLRNGGNRNINIYITLQ